MRTNAEESKKEFTDPVSRKGVKLGELHRELFRGNGRLGRYTERLVTARCPSGKITDTYRGG